MEDMKMGIAEKIANAKKSNWVQKVFLSLK